MGTCVNVIKLVGFSLLGLLSASLTIQSFRTIPDLITRLNNQVSITAASATEVVDSVVRTLSVLKVLNLLLAAVSSGMFYLAYTYSLPLEKHPYLVYSGLGAPLALVSLYWKGGKADCSIHKRAVSARTRRAKNAGVSASVAPETATATATAGKTAKDEDDALGKSYIHVSDDLLSSLTPASSVPSSPQHGAADVAPTTSSIEEEVEGAMSKKEYVHDLEKLQGAYSVALAVSLAGAAVCVVGLVGDMYFL